MGKIKYKDIKQMLTLDAIRHTGNCVPCPTSGDWKCLDKIIKNMHSSGLLVEDEDCYKIDMEGKKLLLLFDDERKRVAGKLGTYKNVLIDKKEIDARIAMMAFMLIYHPPENRKSLMQAVIFAVFWDDLLERVLAKIEEEDSQWQKMILDNKLYDGINNLVDPEAWHQLGKTDYEAKMTGKWLLNPAVLEGEMVKITRV